MIDANTLTHIAEKRRRVADCDAARWDAWTYRLGIR
jgi:hypothetical protein